MRSPDRRPRRAPGPREPRKVRASGASAPPPPVRVPRGALAADLSKQSYGIGGPVHYYKDRRKTCVQCGAAFVFSASEQKHWYEVLRFNLQSTAVRCPACRRRDRSDRALMRRLANATAGARTAPDDPHAQLELAEAIHAHHARLGHPSADLGVAAARRALRLDPRLHEALYREAACHAAAGRAAKARAGWRRFVDAAAGVARCRPLVRRARALGEEASGP